MYTTSFPVAGQVIDLFTVPFQVAKCAYVMAVMSFMWLSEAVPIAVTALVPVFMFPMVGVLSAKDVGESYVNVRAPGQRPYHLIT